MTLHDIRIDGLSKGKQNVTARICQIKIGKKKVGEHEHNETDSHNRFGLVKFNFISVQCRASGNEDTEPAKS